MKKNIIFLLLGCIVLFTSCLKSGLSYVFIGVINMVNTSSILNHADIDLRKTPDFIRVPVELKKEERQLNLKVNDVNEKEYL